jgi:NUMOD4 motif/HNH endonuclease
MTQLSLDDVAEPEPERWEPVADFPLYEISNLGRVRSLPRPFNRGRVLKPWADDSGHLHVTVYADGRSKRPYVHRLVAEAFIGPCPEGKEVCHGPAGMLDNSVGNLSYKTHKENCGPDMLRDGTRQFGEDHHHATLTMAIVSESRRRYAAGEQIKTLMAEFGVARGALVPAIEGKTWPHCPVPPVTGRKAGEKHRDAKLTDTKVREYHARRLAGETIAVMAREAGVTYAALYAALTGKTWKHLSLEPIPTNKY